MKLLDVLNSLHVLQTVPRELWTGPIPLRFPPCKALLWPPTLTSWMDAFFYIEKWESRVAAILVNPADWILPAGTPGLDGTDEPAVKHFFGARLFLTESIPAGTAYLFGNGCEGGLICLLPFTQGEPNPTGMEVEGFDCPMRP